MLQLLWLFIGLIAALPLLWLCERKTASGALNLLGAGLLVAALIYVLFALASGNMFWVEIELYGVLIYSCFYYLALKRGIFWLALGWLLHPLWDIGLHLYGPAAHVAPDGYSVACISFDLIVAGYCFIGNNTRDRKAKVGQSL